MTDTEFLQACDATDGVRLGLELLRDAEARQDAIDTEYSMILCARFGFTSEHVALLSELARSDWHQRHEDVALALDDVRTPQTVEALIHLAERPPGYLRELDDGHALARKAIWALSKVHDPRAHDALVGLSNSTDTYVAETASRRLAP